MSPQPFTIQKRERIRKAWERVSQDAERDGTVEVDARLARDVRHLLDTARWPLRRTGPRDDNQA